MLRRDVAWLDLIRDEWSRGESIVCSPLGEFNDAAILHVD